MFNTKANKIKDQLTKRIISLEQDLRITKFELQASIADNTGDGDNYAYSYNNYREYAKACLAVSDKYENKSAWGSGLTANIVDFRAAVTVSSGPQFKPQSRSLIKQRDDEGKTVGGEDGSVNPNIDNSADREMDFCRSLYDVNDLNHETPQEWGREAEIEGRVAVRLKWDEKKGQVVFEHMPWLLYRYEEERDKLNPRTINKIKWKENRVENIPAGSVEGDLLVCRRFAGRPRGRYPMTKIMRCLTEAEAIGQAFRDWREINRLFAAPIPIFECETDDEAERMDEAIGSGLNFRVKKAWAMHGNFKFASPDMSGVNSLENEIKRLACFVSGTTGYPLQFLLPDMLSNRSTSENIMESALIHTASERAIWTGFYEELISKAMYLWTEKSGKTPLDPNKISITISLMTKEQWDRLTAFWLPAFREDLVTREAVLPMIPDFNVREELDRREEADNSEVARITKELDRLEKEQMSNNLQQLSPDGQQPPPVVNQPTNKPPFFGKAEEQKND